MDFKTCGPRVIEKVNMGFKVVSTNSVDKPLYNLQNKLACDFESKFIKKDSMYSVYLLLLSGVMSGYTLDWVHFYNR